MNQGMVESVSSARAGRPALANPEYRRALWGKVVAFVEAAKFRSVVLLGFVGSATAIWAWREASSPGAAAGTSAAGSVLTRFILATAAVFAGSAGANAITGAIDHRMDALMSRTRHRPVPTGRLTPAESLWFGVILVAAGAVLSALTGRLWATFWLLAGALDVTLLYNGWSKPRTPWSVVLGSPGGSAPVLVAAAAMTGAAASPAALLLAGLVTVWTPIHVWSLAIRYVDDYRAAGVPMLPVAVGIRQAARCVGWAALGLCGLAAVLPWVLGLSVRAAVLVLVLQGPILATSLAVMVKPTPSRSWLLFKLTSPYLAVLFLVVAVAG